MNCGQAEELIIQVCNLKKSFQHSFILLNVLLIKLNIVPILYYYAFRNEKIDLNSYSIPAILYKCFLKPFGKHIQYNIIKFIIYNFIYDIWKLRFR